MHEKAPHCCEAFVAGVDGIAFSFDPVFMDGPALQALAEKIKASYR